MVHAAADLIPAPTSAKRSTETAAAAAESARSAGTSGTTGSATARARLSGCADESGIAAAETVAKPIGEVTGTVGSEESGVRL